MSPNLDSFPICSFRFLGEKKHLARGLPLSQPCRCGVSDLRTGFNLEGISDQPSVSLDTSLLGVDDFLQASETKKQLRR
jgi:hypothetical protein